MKEKIQKKKKDLKMEISQMTIYTLLITTFITII